MKECCSHIKQYRTQNRHKEQQTITPSLITEFGKVAYISGPLSQWGRLSY
jgi:hypothetical protein